MQAIIIANQSFSDASRADLLNYVMDSQLVCTCNFGFINFEQIITRRFFLTPLINVSGDVEIIRAVDNLNVRGVKFYHSEANLGGYKPVCSVPCPQSSWWDSGTHALLTIALHYPFVRTIICYGFSDGEPPYNYFLNARKDALLRVDLRDRFIVFK